MSPAAPRPLNEADRLRVLESYRILDSGAEQAYDDIVRIAAEICHTPIALVTFIGEDRQWYKAKLGVDGEETPREEAFCAHTILGREPMVVRDARQDARFADNPDVTGGLGVRFYAGAPLTSPDGHGLGSLCVIDREPRELDPHQLEALESLARLVVDQLELRKSSSELAEALERVRTLGELIPVCAYCRRVRDDQQYWEVLEGYLTRQLGTKVSHGICPDCFQEHFPEAADEADPPTIHTTESP